MLQECLFGNGPTLNNFKEKIVESQNSCMKKNKYLCNKAQLKMEEQQEVSKKIFMIYIKNYKSHNNK